ncbi:MAG: Nramp family divalent metal transporter [Candidatus Izemoplasmatales bacterium]|nr:Nramp family divalent metal transporter [Candidatus Izemoplasmatales bacterium]
MTKQTTSSNLKQVDTTNRKGFFRKLAAFIGPAYLVSVGYMDPGNWATDIAGGSQFGYRLIWIILLSNIMAILFQSLSSRLGIISGKDLAQASSSHYPKTVNFILWILSEIAIISTDIAELLGTAIGISLIFKVPILWGVVITGFDTLLLMVINKLGIRKMEAFIILLIFIIGASFLAEIIISQPDYHNILSGFVPSIPNATALYIGIGIIGATIMPHNLYLHSSLVQTRKIDRTPEGFRQAIKFNIIDSVIALNFAFLVNAAILIVAAAVFYESGRYDVGDIITAHQLLEPILGSNLAPILFGIALIAAGQSSTITGTYAGQVVMEGYIHLRLQPWVRRLITRLLAIIPALFVIITYGEGASAQLLILSQVILSLQLSFAVVPLIHFVSSKKFMKDYAIKVPMRVVAWFLAAVILGLNVVLVYNTMTAWLSSGVHIVVYLLVILGILALIGLLVFIVVEPFLNKFRNPNKVSIHHLNTVPQIAKIEPYKKIALALDFSQSDSSVLSHTLHLSNFDTQILLIHIVESAGAEIYGDVIQDQETEIDSKMLEQYKKRLNELGYRNVVTEIGFGQPHLQIPKLVNDRQVDLIVFGSHGHRGFKDLMFGSVFDRVKHRLKVPMMVAKFTEPPM